MHNVCNHGKINRGLCRYYLAITQHISHYRVSQFEMKAGLAKELSITARWIGGTFF